LNKITIYFILSTYKFSILIDGRMLQANLSWTRKKSNSSDTKNFVCVYIFLFCT